MQKLSFKNRIALNYIVTTALLVFIVFFAIYTIVKYSVYNHVNSDISKEVKNHLSEIVIVNHNISLLHKEEWEEREHNTVDVNPVFIQFLDSEGVIWKKSPNLKKHFLVFNKKVENYTLFDTQLLKNRIRQIQVPIYDEGHIIGHILIAMSLEEATMVLNNLSKTLLIAFPLILMILFFIARFIAGRSIKPISAIIKTSDDITKDNLHSRIRLPQKRDELYVLSQTINNLLDRIETAIEREKQFTSDASHELRTPLTVIKGTLEVLVRKPRNQEEYQEKINHCINEVDRLNNLTDQLLLLARHENQNHSIKKENFAVNTVIEEVILNYANLIHDKNINVHTDFRKDFYVANDRYLVSVIINNLISNAIKYSFENSNLTISLKQSEGKVECYISDSGIGIPKEDFEKILQPFYRSKSSNNLNIKGMGLGMSIVKRLCELLTISIEIKSEEQIGTTIILEFI